MDILVACEESGVVRDALRARGHNAISCDLKPTRREGPHYQCDVFDVLGYRWDAMIAHPDCTFLCNSGVRWLYEREGRWAQMQAGAETFLKFKNAKHIPKRVIENSLMHYHARNICGAYTQVIQPWMFGDPRTKAAELHIAGLPPLKPERTKDSYAPGEIKAYAHKLPPGPDRAMLRSETSPEVARAFAEQWF